MVKISKHGYALTQSPRHFYISFLKRYNTIKIDESDNNLMKNDFRLNLLYHILLQMLTAIKVVQLAVHHSV